MEKDDISKLEEQVKALSGEGSEETTTEETKIVDDIQDLETTEEVEFEEKEEDTEEIEEDTEEIEEDTEEIEEVSEEKSVEDDEMEDIAEEILPKEEKEPPKKKKSSKKWIIALIIGIVVLLCILGIVISLKTKKTDTSSKELTQGQKKQIIEEYGDALEGIISVYLDKQQILLEYEDAILLVKYDHDVVCDEHEIYEDGQVFLDKCSIDDVGVTYSYGKKQEKPVVKEGAIKVYVSKKTKEATLTEPSDVKQYDLYSFDIEGQYSGLTLLGKKSSYVFYYSHATDSNCMINYLTGEKALVNLSYDNIIPIQYGETYDSSYAAVEINDKWGIYNLDSDEKTIATIYDTFPLLTLGVSGPLSKVTALADGVVPVAEYYQVDNQYHAKYGLINYRTKQVIISCDHTSMLRTGDYLWAIDAYGNKHIYDYNGVDQFNCGQYDTVYGCVDGKYVLVKDKSHIKLVSLSNKLLYDYGELNLGKYYYGLVYKNGSIFQFEDMYAEQEDIDSRCIELIYDSSTKSGEKKSSYCGGIAKPILYLYPEKTTKVTVQFEHPELLETTYPKYLEKWEVTAKKNGDLTDKNGKYYYALYWDEAQIHSTDFSTGYYVTKDKAASFLEQKLTYIGLTDRERNEFIMYWLPVLERNEKSLVYFELTGERDSYNKIFITPKPDSLLRLVIHIKKVDQEIEIPKQKLTKFQRKGFVAVEWGGVTY